MEQRNQEAEVEVQSRAKKAESVTNNNQPRWSNGQCVVVMPSCSTFSPSFDLSSCRAKLAQDGFQIPASDMEIPLKTALDVPSVKRYLVFNSRLFHLIMAPILYVVLWCAVFSTLHLYISVSDYWVLCLSVSLVSILLTTAIIFMLHHSNKQINVNVDVRLVQVNERMVKHKLLVGVADWVENCTGNMQLFFVYWDMSRCLKTLTETLEELDFVTPDAQNKLRSRMSHLILVSEDLPEESESGGSDVEAESDENRPLLHDVDCSTSSHQRREPTVTSSFSLAPDASLPAQVKAHRLLMTYSAAYVKLLVSKRLSGPSHHRMRLRRNHCSVSPVCLCQYIKKKVLQ
ncbi:transmembrane protein 268 [Oryzias melastigma]|uniref:Transmembrane protein 268 n=1 Tax=Oryzias melastigma TaxID=30732 RepID=A0A3B3BQE4_ORYME|nr:transmembrane protein 268 [Oryzias melastigma]